MSSSYLDLVRKHSKKIITGGVPSPNTEIVFVNSLGDTATVNGIAPTHHTGVDSEGYETSTMQAHVTVNESDLNDQGYTTRDANEDCTMKDDLVSFADSTGVTKTYVVIKHKPDTAFGHFTLTLGKHE